MACTRVEIGAKGRNLESDPMVGMINDNGDCPVNLFEKHDAQQTVGKRHGAEA